MKAAELEALSMNDSTNDATNDCCEVVQITERMPERMSERMSERMPERMSEHMTESAQESETLPHIPMPAMNNTNISAMLNRIANNPEEVTKVMQESMGQMSPDMMEEARKLAMGGQGKQLMREMQRRGIDPNVMRAQLLEQQKALRNMTADRGDTKSVILITHNRQLKVRNISAVNVSLAVQSVMKSSTIVELSCSRLANGPLEKKTIKVWCDPGCKGKNNRRLAKIVGFPIAGDGVVVVEDEDLTEADFLAAERLLE